MAKKLQDIMSKAVPIAQKTCDYTDPRPQKAHVQKNEQAELDYIRPLNAAVQQYAYHRRSNNLGWHAPMRIQVENIIKH